MLSSGRPLVSGASVKTNPNARTESTRRMANVPPPPIAAITFGKKKPVQHVAEEVGREQGRPTDGAHLGGQALRRVRPHEGAVSEVEPGEEEHTRPTTLSSLDGPLVYASSSSVFATAMVVMPDSNVGRRP